MSNIPPVQSFANYPRASAITKEQVQMAADAHWGFGKAFLVTVLFSLCTLALHAVSQDETFQLVAMGIRLIGTGVFVFFITYPLNKKLGVLMEWPEGKPRTISIVMGVISATCMGIVAFIWGQQMSTLQLAKLGVPKKWYGFTKKGVKAYIATLPSSSEIPAPVPPMSL